MQNSYGQVEKYAQLMRKNAVAMMQSELKAQEKEQQKMQSAQMEEQRKNMQVQSEIQRKEFDVQKKNERADRV